ncbi:MAG: crossover junction endodeoxyribonuclease RuvC [Desulfosalsimonas sp.]
MAAFLGIDPGLASTGIAVVEGSRMTVSGYSYGVIQTAAKDPVPRRLDRISRELQKILEKIRPDAIIVEDVFSLPRYPKSGITLGRVSGVILLAGFRAGVAVQEIAVREVKQVLTGNGNAGKRQLEQSVRARVGHHEPIRPSHASDALALALVGLYRSGICAESSLAGNRFSGGAG